MKYKPVKISLNSKSNLIIHWDDESETKITLDKLRRLCPCATCITEREREGKNYIPLYSQNQVMVKSIKNIGNYAIEISWQDGHSTGIYEYSYLRVLSQEKIVE